MSASIADPFLLSNYIFLKSKTAANASSSLSKSSKVYATQQHASASSAGKNHVTVAAQGDGVHVLDVSTLHPVISHTLGPSTSFSCPAVTLTTSQNGLDICRTFAVLDSAQDITTEERGRTVRMWRECPTGEAETTLDRKRHTLVLPHRVSNILLPEDLPNHVLFVGVRGELSTADADMNLKHSYTHSELPENLKPLRSFVFSRKMASFTPTRTAPKQGSLVVTFLAHGPESQLQVLVVDENATIVPLGTVPLPVQKSDIIDVSCSESGWMGVITHSGDWAVFQIDSPDFATVAFTQRTPIPIRTLSFTPTPASRHPDFAPVLMPAFSPYMHEVSILSLGSSHVLLAGVSSAQTGSELALLLWDLQYSVLLASHIWALPASVIRTKKMGVDLVLSGPSAHVSQVLLTMTSRTPSAGLVNGDSQKEGPLHPDDGTLRSSVLVVPVTVPEVSTIAAAIGRASASQRWLPSPLKSFTEGLTNQSDIKIVRGLVDSLSHKKVKAAEDAFARYLKVQDEEGKKIGLAPNARYGREFVKRVLEVLFHPREGEKKVTEQAELLARYSPKVLRWLLERQVVSSNMVRGSLLSALRLRNDWESVLLALKTVADISEDNLMSLCHLCVTHHRQKQSQGDEGMQVDNSAGEVPSLTTALSLCVTYPVSAPALRLAIRTHFRDADDLTIILQVLADWLKVWSVHEVTLLPERTKKDLHGATVPVFEEVKPDIPPVEKVLTFLQALIDSSILTFLSHPPSHILLQAVLDEIEPELNFMDDIEQLRGVLQPFAKAQVKHVHESANGAQKPDLSIDWRRRRKEHHEQAAIAVGVYQIEELVL